MRDGNRVAWFVAPDFQAGVGIVWGFLLSHKRVASVRTHNSFFSLPGNSLVRAQSNQFVSSMCPGQLLRHNQIPTAGVSQHEHGSCGSDSRKLSLPRISWEHKRNSFQRPRSVPSEDAAGLAPPLLG